MRLGKGGGKGLSTKWYEERVANILCEGEQAVVSCRCYSLCSTVLFSYWEGESIRKCFARSTDCLC